MPILAPPDWARDPDPIRDGGEAVDDPGHSPTAAALEEAWEAHRASLAALEATEDEMPGGAVYAALWSEAERIGDREWRNATDEERIRRVVRAGVTRRRLAASLPGAGIDAADLLALELPPLRWIIPELIPEGTAILASPPKVGKSCLVYQITTEVALGGELLGRRVTSGSALYLALEDGQRRGQDRLRAALAGRTMPHGRLEVRWAARKTGAGLEDDLAAWLDAHPDAALVAIDTLGKVRPRSDGRRNAYEVDVEDLGRLQDLFRDRQVALVIVHHVKKDAGDDFLASVSGTYGVTGSADTIIAVRRKRLEAFGSILVTGRDVKDAEVHVRFDGMTWSAAPASLGEASFERLEVYRAIEATGPIFPAAIAEQTGLGRTSVQNMVGKLVETGAVIRTSKGYVAATPLARAGAGNPDDYCDSESLADDPHDSVSHGSHHGHPRARATVGERMAADIGALDRDDDGPGAGGPDDPTETDEDWTPDPLADLGPYPMGAAAQ